MEGRVAPEVHTGMGQEWAPSAQSGRTCKITQWPFLAARSSTVIFQYCYGEVRDKEDYLAFECFGSEKSNKSIVFTEGKMIEGTWWRDGDNAAPAKYLDENGKRVLLNQGKTWICIIWLDYEDDVVIE